MDTNNVFIKYLNNHGVDAVQLLSAKELAKRTVLTDDEEVEAIVNAMMSRMSNYVTQSQLNAYTTYSQMTEYIQNNVQAFPEATNLVDEKYDGVFAAIWQGGSSYAYSWCNYDTFLNDTEVGTHIASKDWVTNQISQVMSSTASLLSNYATLSALSAFAPASTLSSYVTTSALTQNYMPVWYGSQAAFDALPANTDPNKLYIIIN